MCWSTEKGETEEKLKSSIKKTMENMQKEKLTGKMDNTRVLASSCSICKRKVKILRFKVLLHHR